MVVGGTRGGEKTEEEKRRTKWLVPSVIKLHQDLITWLHLKMDFNDIDRDGANVGSKVNTTVTINLQKRVSNSKDFTSFKVKMYFNIRAFYLSLCPQYVAQVVWNS